MYLRSICPKWYLYGFGRLSLYLKHIWYLNYILNTYLNYIFVQNKSTEEYSNLFQIPYLNCDLKRITFNH